MRPGLTSATWWACFAVASVMACANVRAEATDLKLQALLVWGTNDDKSPDPNHKPVEPEIRKKLKGLPLRWAHYFEVQRKELVIPAKGSGKTPLGRCEIEVKDLGNSNLEISQYGKGKPVVRQIQTLPKGDILVLGGNAPNDTAWLVILKRVE